MSFCRPLDLGLVSNRISLFASIYTSSIVVHYYHIFSVYPFPALLWPISVTSSLFGQTSSTTQQFGESFDFLPPRFLSPSVLHIGSLEHISNRRKDDLTALDGDAGGRLGLIARRNLVAALVGRLLRGGHSVFFEELHASQCETGRSSSVQGRRSSTLQCVTKLRGSSVEQVFAFFLENVGQDLGRVNL